MFRRGVCIVLGGAKGVGKKCVEKCAARGMEIAYIDIDKQAGTTLKAKLRSEYGVEAFFFHGDVNKEEDREIFGSVIAERYKQIDYLLNNVSSSKVDHRSNAN